MSLLICTDLDRTLLPNGRAVESPRARCYFHHLLRISNAQLAYVSGRSLALVKAAIQQYALPTPNYIIADVGTSLYVAYQDTWQPYIQWQQHLKQTWSDTYAPHIQQLLKNFSVLHLQAPEQQTAYKISYFLNLAVASQDLLHCIQQQLSQHNIDANLIYSVDELNELALLDIIPSQAGKYHAIQFLRNEQNTALTETVFAGDSGNDLTVLQSEIPSILVNNADVFLKQQAQQLSQAAGHTQALYIARGNCLDMNGNYAAGIIEGVLHYHPEFSQALAHPF